MPAVLVQPPPVWATVAVAITVSVWAFNDRHVLLGAPTGSSCATCSPITRGYVCLAAFAPSSLPARPSKSRGHQYAAMTSAEEFESGTTVAGKTDSIHLSCGAIPPKYIVILRHDIVMMIMMDMLAVRNLVLGLCPRRFSTAALPFRFGVLRTAASPSDMRRQKVRRVIRRNDLRGTIRAP